MKVLRFLTAASIAAMALTVPVMNAAAEESNVFSADFETVSSVTESGLWTWSDQSSGSFDIITESNGNHAAKITPNSEPNQELSNQIGYNFDKPYESGVVTISYRMKYGKDRYDGFVLRSTQNGANTDVYAPRFYWGRCAAGQIAELGEQYKYPIAIGENGSMWASTDGWANENEWYTVTDVLDLDNDLLKVTVFKADGTKLGCTAEYPYTGNLAAVYADSRRPGADGTETLFDDLKISYSDNKIAIMEEPWERYNIFPGSEPQKYTVKLKNTTGAAQSVKLRAEAVNSMGFTVYSKEFEPLTVQPEDYPWKLVEMDLKEYGIFTLKLTAEYTESGSSKKRTVEKEVPFTVINDSSTLNPRMGVNTHLGYYGGQTYFLARTAARAGFGISREEIRWSEVEKTRDSFEISNPDIREIPAKVSENGMEQLMILAFSNTLYCDNEYTVPSTDTEIEAYKKYCSYMASTYKDQVKYYEVWNEYNYKEFNKNSAGADTYIKLLKAASEAVKAADPDAIVVGVCAGGNDPENGFKYMREVLEKGGLSYMDAISFHPYQWNRESNMDRFAQDIWTVRNMLKEYGKENMPIYVTEMGWSTGTSVHCVSELQEAISAVEMYTTAMSTGQCDKVLWYDLVNDGVTGEREQNFGLLRGRLDDIPFSAKPAYAALAGMNKLLGNAEYVDKKIVGDTVIHRFRKSDGEYAAVAWSSKDSEQIRLKLGTDNVSVRDLYSNVMTTNARADGLHVITTSWEPRYITGDLSVFEDAGSGSDSGDAVFSQNFEDGTTGNMWVWKQNDSGNVEVVDSGSGGKAARLNNSGQNDLQLGIRNVNYSSGVVTVSCRIKPGKGKINGMIFRGDSGDENHSNYDVHAPYFYWGGARVGTGINDGSETEVTYAYSGSRDLNQDKWYTVVDVLDLDNDTLTVNVYDEEWNRECKPVTYSYTKNLNNIFFSAYDESNDVTANETLVLLRHRSNLNLSSIYAVFGVSLKVCPTRVPRDFLSHERSKKHETYRVPTIECGHFPCLIILYIKRENNASFSYSIVSISLPSNFSRNSIRDFLVTLRQPNFIDFK